MPEKVKRVKMLDQVVELDLDSKVVKCHYTEDFLKDINKTLEDVEEFLSDCKGCWNCTNCTNCTTDSAGPTGS